MEENKDKGKSLKERYKDKLDAPTPAEEWLEGLARVTAKKVSTVKLWMCDAQMPDELTRRTLAQHFGTDEETLFPLLKEMRKEEQL